jgi:type IV pilus assembly protein PilV
MTHPHPCARGFTLIEVMISLSILLVGLLAMMNLQIWGMNSNQGARAQMQATQLAREIASAIQQLPYDDSRLAPTASFGSLLGVAGGYTNLTTLPGVRLDADIESDADGLVYRRRWTVQTVTTGGVASTGAKVVAISVIFHERGIPAPREVLMFVSKTDLSGLGANIGAYN